MNKIKLDAFEKEIENNAEAYTSASKKTKNRVKKIISKANEKNRITLRKDNIVPPR